MHLPPVHPISETEYFVSGDVIIRETAAIAPGVILDAGSGCQILIGAGVCLGMGTVIIAYAGNVEIGDGVILAPGTLVIGPVTVGQGACVGSRSTIFRQNIPTQALIPPGELLMVVPAPPLSSQSVASSPANKEEIKPIPSPWDSGESAAAPPSNPQIICETPTGHQATQGPIQQKPEVVPPPTPPNEPEVIPTQPESTEMPDRPGAKVPVVGQIYINQLLLTLFPERKFFQS